MKRVDFSFHNDLSATPVDAVQRTTFTAPIDITGDVRITKFKLSSNAFPLLLIPPLDMVFDAANKERLDTLQKTPLDFFFGFSQTRGNIIPSRDGAIVLSDTNETKYQIAKPNFESLQFLDFNTVQCFYSNEAPQWKQTTSGWKLTNKPVFLYNFEDLYNPEIFYIQTSGDDNQSLRLTMVGNNLEFYYSKWSQLPPSRFMSTPIVWFSKTIANLLGIVSPDSYVNTLLDVYPLNLGVTCYSWHMEYKYNRFLEQAISARALTDPNSTHMYNWSTTAIHPINGHDVLYPYTALILIFDEFNNPGERIVVNNTSGSGVISLSTLSISKTFLLAHTNMERSDFIFLDDSKQQYPLKVNLPRQTYLTSRLYFLLKDNTLVPLKIPLNQSYFVQITITDE